MTLQDAVAQYLAAGGTVTAVPGFTGIKPMPPRAAPQKRQAAPKAVRPDRATAGWYTALELALELDYASVYSVSLLQAEGVIPDPCGKRGRSAVWSPEVVQEIVAQVAEYKKQRKLRNLMRQAISAEAESAKAICANVASYAKKQRNKRELAKEWKELDK